MYSAYCTCSYRIRQFIFFSFFWNVGELVCFVLSILRCGMAEPKVRGHETNQNATVCRSSQHKTQQNVAMCIKQNKQRHEKQTNWQNMLYIADTVSKIQRQQSYMKRSKRAENACNARFKKLYV